jgi:N-acetylmuramoyl-L-alanine amidase
MTSIVISSGHGIKVRGASGYLDEVDEAIRVMETVADILLKHGFGVITFTDEISSNQSDNLEAIVDFHNAQTRELDVSVHFNAYTKTDKPMGTEVLYLTAADAAARVSNAISKAGFLNRGAKYRDDLYFLNQTEQTTFGAILIEVCFVDSKADAELYTDRFLAVCRLIAAAIALSLSDEPIAFDKGVIPDNQKKITASVFGGDSDYNVSAYDEDLVLDDEHFYVALPDRFEGERPQVVVHNRESGDTATASIEDVGPWNIDDPYWTMGTRPQAESGTDETGRTTNKAGIDLSPALARELGIDGMGEVDWQFLK